MRGGRGVWLSGLAISAALGAAAAFGQDGSLPLPTTADDFHQPGTQVLGLFDEVQPYSSCSFCHANWDLTEEPARWRGSMHRHSARDPLFLAAVSIANQDAPGSGETCFRCHAPRAWVDGRIEGNPNGAAPPMYASDFDNGVTCNFCHRTVDPDFKPGVSPDIDETILTALGADAPQWLGNATFVLDPSDVRRGPIDYSDAEYEPPHPWEHSPFHHTSDMCGQCHSVSNPLYQPAEGGGFELNAFGSPHATQSPHDMFPEQRTYEEWAQSMFAQGPVELEGRFGGSKTAVSTCQDCHMPDTTGNACAPFFGFPQYDDLPYHSFAGANRWMIDVIEHMYADELSDEDFEAFALQRLDVETMLVNATDMGLDQELSDLRVTITNYTGHKLLTGMPEGRRIWVNVRFFDGSSALIAERGAYNAESAVLSEADTKVYEAKLGVDAYASAVTGVPAGPSFHLMLANTVEKDNRIPPMGFTNAGFEAVGAGHVGYTYADGQNWDLTRYQIPAGAASATVTLYYQTASKEYIEFLRDTNTTDERGDELHAAWVATGKSPPFAMDQVTIALDQYVVGDLNGNRVVNSVDLNILLFAFGNTEGVTAADGDIDADGVVGSTDLNMLLANFGMGA